MYYGLDFPIEIGVHQQKCFEEAKKRNIIKPPMRIYTIGVHQLKYHVHNQHIGGLGE